MKKRIRKLRGIVSIVRLVRDPDRLDEVFELAESMGDDAILSQMAADVAGELGLQAFGLAQFPSRLAALLIAGGLLHAVISRFDDRDARMRAIVRGWLLGKRAQKFFGVRWGEMWSRPIDEVRSELGIDLRALEDELPVRPRPAEVPAAA